MIAAGIFYTIEMFRSRDNTAIMLNQLIDNVEFTSKIAAYTNNQQIAKEVIQGLIANEMVQEVKISGDQGLYHEESTKPLSQNSLKIKRSLLSPFDNRQVIGSISVVSSGYFQLVEAKSGALRSAIYAFITIVLTTSILFWVFLRPITKIVNTLHKRMIKENLCIESSLPHHQDELGRLEIDVNTLLTLIEEKNNYERTLQAKIDGLEMQMQNNYESKKPTANFTGENDL